MRIFLIVYVLLIISVVSILGFRGASSEKTPLEIFPDMDNQARFRAQGENTFFSDARDDRPIPAHTVARGNFLSYANVFSADFSDEQLGDTIYNEGKSTDGTYYDGFPVDVNEALMKIGEEKYGIFCAVCHGAAGDGNGVTKPYGVLAPSFHDERLRGVAAGEIFETISNGKGLMYGLKDRLSPKERWAIVLYLRALQRTQDGRMSDVPAGLDIE